MNPLQLILLPAQNLFRRLYKVNLTCPLILMKWEVYQGSEYLLLRHEPDVSCRSVNYFCVTGEKMGGHWSCGLFHSHPVHKRGVTGATCASHWWESAVSLVLALVFSFCFRGAFTMPREITRQLYGKILLYLENFCSLVFVNVKWCWLFESKLSMRWESLPKGIRLQNKQCKVYFQYS